MHIDYQPISDAQTGRPYIVDRIITVFTALPQFCVKIPNPQQTTMKIFQAALPPICFHPTPSRYLHPAVGTHSLCVRQPTGNQHQSLRTHRPAPPESTEMQSGGIRNGCRRRLFQIEATISTPDGIAGGDGAVVAPMKAQRIMGVWEKLLTLISFAKISPKSHLTDGSQVKYAGLNAKCTKYTAHGR